jgi:hypothetical protein
MPRTVPTPPSIEATADAVGPALGGADAVEIASPHRLVALRPVDPRPPPAVPYPSILPRATRAPRIAAA